MRGEKNEQQSFHTNGELLRFVYADIRAPGDQAGVDCQIQFHQVPPKGQESRGMAAAYKEPMIGSSRIRGILPWHLSSTTCQLRSFSPDPRRKRSAPGMLSHKRGPFVCKR